MLSQYTNPPLTAIRVHIEHLGEVANDPVFEITKEEFPVYGSLRYKEHCLKVNFSDKTREIVYKYQDYEIIKENNVEELIIKLKDSNYDFYINLHYTILIILNGMLIDQYHNLQ